MEPTNSLMNVLGLCNAQVLKRSFASVSPQSFHICSDALKAEKLERTTPLCRVSESETHVYDEEQSKFRGLLSYYRREKQRPPEGNPLAWREAIQNVNVPALEKHISRMLCSKTNKNVYTDGRWKQFSVDHKLLSSTQESSSPIVTRSLCSLKPLKLTKKATGVSECISEESGLNSKQKFVKITDGAKTDLKQNPYCSEKPVLKEGNTSDDRNWKPRSSNWRVIRDGDKNKEPLKRPHSAEAVDILTKVLEKTSSNNTPSEPAHISPFEKKIDQQLDKKNGQSNKGSTSSNYVDLSSINPLMSEETKTSKPPIESPKQAKLEVQISQKPQLDKVQLLNKGNEDCFNKSTKVRNEVSNRVRTLSSVSTNVVNSTHYKTNYEKPNELPTTSGLLNTGSKDKSQMKLDKLNSESSYSGSLSSEKSSWEIMSEIRARRRQQLAEYVAMWSEQREELEAIRQELLKSDPERYRAYRMLAKKRSIKEIYRDFYPHREGEGQASYSKQPVIGRLELLGKINDTKRREQLMKSVFGDGPQALTPAIRFANTSSNPLVSQRRNLQKIRSNFNVNQEREYSVDLQSQTDCDIKGSLKYILDFKSRLLEK